MRPLLITALLLAGCRHAAPPADLHTRDVAEMAPATASVVAEVVRDPSAAQVELGPGEELMPAQLMSDNRPPKYPAALVAAGLPPRVVTLRVTFDEEGDPMAVQRSPVGTTTQDRYTADFELAASGALWTWRCWPPRIRKFRGGPDGDGDGKPDYRIVAAEKLLKTYFDVAFSFEVVNGEPVVKRTR